MGLSPTALVERSARLRIDDIDFAAFREMPLEEDDLRCLRYMHDIESHTVCYLRDLLVTRVHRDPEITAFLACWCYEEHWHGDALGKVLEAHGEEPSSARVARLRARLPRSDGIRPLLFSLGSGLTRHLPALHMTWGAINERVTQSGYARLSARAQHPVLSELLSRIMRQEGRHIDFYSDEARRRLTGSRRAQRLTRFILGRYWAPVGSGVMPPDEVRHLARYLFSGEDGLAVARRVDRQVARLPGLEGLALLERSVVALG